MSHHQLIRCVADAGDVGLERDGMLLEMRQWYRCDQCACLQLLTLQRGDVHLLLVPEHLVHVLFKSDVRLYTSGEVIDERGITVEQASSLLRARRGIPGFGK